MQLDLHDLLLLRPVLLATVPLARVVRRSVMMVQRETDVAVACKVTARATLGRATTGQAMTEDYRYQRLGFMQVLSGTFLIHLVVLQIGLIFTIESSS